eukprot:UN13597
MLDDEKTDEMEEKIVRSPDEAMFASKDKWFLIFWAIYIICAILVFMVIEGDTFVSAFYFRIVTSFGVGYGDYVPQTAMGRILNCVFIVIDLAKLAYTDWRLISLLFKYRQRKYTSYDMVHSSSPHPNDETYNSANVNISDNIFAKIISNPHFLSYILVLLGLFFLSGTLVMGLHEGYMWLDAVEWNFVTLSQVGYGDTVPQTVGGTIFT